MMTLRQDSLIIVLVVRDKDKRIDLYLSINISNPRIVGTLIKIMKSSTTIVSKNGGAATEPFIQLSSSKTI